MPRLPTQRMARCVPLPYGLEEEKASQGRAIGHDVCIDDRMSERSGAWIPVPHHSVGGTYRYGAVVCGVASPLHPAPACAGHSEAHGRTPGRAYHCRPSERCGGTPAAGAARERPHVCSFRTYYLHREQPSSHGGRARTPHERREEGRCISVASYFAPQHSLERW